MPGSWAVAVPSGKQIDVAVHHEISIAPVVDAWKYLLENGESLAQDAGVKPEELILGISPLEISAAVVDRASVTCTGTNQDFYIRHNDPFGGHMPALQPPQFGFNRAHPFGQQPPGMHGLNQRGMYVAHHQFHRPALPSIFYLFTSMDLEHEPYWSQTPVCVSKGAAIPQIPREYTYHIGW